MHSHTYLFRPQTADESIYVANQVLEEWQLKNVMTVPFDTVNRNTTESFNTLHHTHKYLLWVVDLWTLSRVEAGGNVPGCVRFGMSGSYLGLLDGDIEDESLMVETSDAEWVTESAHRHSYSIHLASQTRINVEGTLFTVNIVPFEVFDGDINEWRETETGNLTSLLSDEMPIPYGSHLVRTNPVSGVIV